MSAKIGRMNYKAAIGAALLLGGLAVSPLVLSQTAQEGKNLGALAKANLEKKRPKAPIDLTGTYNFKMEGNPLTAFAFLPVPPLTPAAQAISDKKKAYTAKGLEWRDDSAACWPLVCR